MFWQDEKEQAETYEVPDDVVDVLFKLSCKTLPLDHGDVLAQQVIKHLPWIEEEPLAAIHQVHVAESANGWMRPDNPETDVLCVSRRTKLAIRLPKNRLEDAQALVGQTLDIDGHELTVGDFTTRSLSKLTTIFARYVDTGGIEDESQFLHNVHQQLQDMGIRVKKMMSGKLVVHHTTQGDILTRKLMLSDLDVEQSVLLQQQGLGDKQLLGIGIFMPHKGIDAVNKKQEN